MASAILYQFQSVKTANFVADACFETCQAPYELAIGYMHPLIDGTETDVLDVARKLCNRQ